jgi:hypothetical protein
VRRRIALTASGGWGIYAAVHGGDTLEKKPGHAEMEALAPHLRDNARLRTLVLSRAELGKEKDSVGVLAQALQTNTTVTVLDLSNNADGAKVVAKLLAKCARRCCFLRLVIGF